MSAAHEDLTRVQEARGSGNRSFGFVFAAAFLLIALWPLLSAAGVRWWAAIASAAFLVAAVVAPSVLAIPNRLWQRLGELLNRIVSPVVLGILFYALFTPVGVIRRLFGADPLRLRRSQAESYWIKRDPPGPAPESMSRQF